MAEHRCPWWMGYVLISPVRRWLQQPESLLKPYLRPGFTILEPGPGMGFYTLPAARLVGEHGRVIAVDVEARMLQALGRRALRARLDARIECRLSIEADLGVDDLRGRVDVLLALAMVHEMPSAADFFRQAVPTLRPGGLLILAEPSGHVTPAAFEEEIRLAQAEGMDLIERPRVRQSFATVLRKL